MEDLGVSCVTSEDFGRSRFWGNICRGDRCLKTNRAPKWAYQCRISKSKKLIIHPRTQSVDKVRNQRRLWFRRQNIQTGSIYLWCSVPRLLSSISCPPFDFSPVLLALFLNMWAALLLPALCLIPLACLIRALLSRREFSSFWNAEEEGGDKK